MGKRVAEFVARKCPIDGGFRGRTEAGIKGMFIPIARRDHDASCCAVPPGLDW
jgi:hypothetical protein